MSCRIVSCQFLLVNSGNLITKFEKMRNANSFKSLHDDFVLVDESQDFPEEFLCRCLSLIKENRFV